MARGPLRPRPPMNDRALPPMRALLLGTIAALAVVTGASGRTSSPAADTQVEDAAPSWSPDGKTIAFASRASGHWQIYTVHANGGGRRALTSGSLDSIDVAWSPNGKQLAFSRVTGGQV